MDNNTTQHEKSQDELSSSGLNSDHYSPNNRGGANTPPQKGTEDVNIVYAGDYESIPNGIYQAVVIGYEKAEFYRQEKLYLWFQIVEGAHTGKQVFMAFYLY